MTDPRRRLADIARRQHGVFTRAQALEAGLTRHQLQHGTATTRYERIAPGVYRLAGTPPSWHQSVVTAVLAGGDGAVASHRSAAVLWGLDGVRAGTPEVSVPRHRRRQERAGLRVHESTDLELAEPHLRQGVRTTGIERTLIDLAAVVGPKRLTQAVDDAIRRRLTTWPQLAKVRARHSRRGRNGVGILRSLLDERFGTTIPDSWFGRLVADLLVDAGLPGPVVEYDVRGRGGRWIARVDLAYPDARVAIELDSKRHHLHEAAFEADRPRQNAMELAGWTVLRFTWAFYSHHPMRLCAEVDTALRSAGGHLALVRPA
jgi:hypothetical protein